MILVGQFLIFFKIAVNSLHRMSFTNDLLCKNGMVVHHNNVSSKIGLSFLLKISVLFTVEINDVIRNHALIDLLFYLEFNL